MTHPFTQTFPLNQPFTFTHSRTRHSSPHSMSRTCSLNYSRISTLKFHWQIPISLTYFHSFTHPLTVTSHHWIPRSQSHLTWSHCHSQLRNEWLVQLTFACFVKKILVTRDVFMFSITRLAFNHAVLPNYAGSIDPHLRVKLIKWPKFMNKDWSLSTIEAERV